MIGKYGVLKKCLALSLEMIRMDLYWYDTEEKPSINNVQVNFRGRKPVILGCAGDGGFYEKWANLELHEDWPHVTRAEFREVVFGPDNLFLDLMHSENALVMVSKEVDIELRNEGDELFVTVTYPSV